MNKTLKIILFGILGIIGVALILSVAQGFFSSFNPGAQIQKAQNRNN